MRKRVRTEDVAFHFWLKVFPWLQTGFITLLAIIAIAAGLTLGLATWPH